MGADTSLPLVDVKPGFSTMCLSFHYSDQITVLHADSGTLSTIRQAIMDRWQSGIQSESARCGTGVSFKLRGYPFLSSSSSHSQQARQMVCQILQRLYSIGWNVVVSTDLGRFNDKSTIFFKKSSGQFSSVFPFVCVGLSSTDKLQIINLPSQLVEPIKQVICQSWIYGVQNMTSGDGLLEVKLSGNPWVATDQESVLAKVLLQNIISTLHRYQWVYTVNVNLKSTADSLYFRYDPNVPVGEASQFCVISLNRTDRIRLISAPQHIINLVRGVIQTTWSHGVIQNEGNHHGSWEFKISGNPWNSTKEESVMARYLILKIIEAMLQHGWHNIAGIDICRRPTDKSVLVFRQGEPKRCPMMSLSLNDGDKFRLINMPSQLADLFRQILLSRWRKGIQAEKDLSLTFGIVHQIKLCGWPWNGGINNDAIHIRSFLCNIFEEFAHRGWRVLLGADVSAKYVHQDKGPDYPIDVHSFWFIYDPQSSAQSSVPRYGFNFAPPTQQYGLGLPAAPHPPTGGTQTTGYGFQTAYPAPSEPPPSYSQATGWS